MSETTVLSFVLRFVQEQENTLQTPTADWRGIIRHVQTNEELRFTTIEDALTFMSEYITLESVTWLKKEEIQEGGSDLT